MTELNYVVKLRSFWPEMNLMKKPQVYLFQADALKKNTKSSH